MPANDKICFDRVLPTEMSLPPVGRMVQIAIGKARAAFQISKLWPNGTEFHIRFIGGTAQQRNVVTQFAPQWTQHANLKFIFDDAPNAQIRIAFNGNDGAWSYIGKDALNIPLDQPTMNLGWQDEGVVLHEFGHAIGMIHEHQNPIANPIQWNKPNVIAALSGSPNFWPPETIQHNMFDKYDLSQINGSNFDAQSVMLYSFPANWTTNGFQSDPNESLSAVDKAFAKTVYPASGPNTSVVELTVYEPGTGVAGSIGQTGEEDQYKFKVQNPGVYTIETDGATDLVMSLFGPNSNTALLAQDDDSGVGRNPKITQNLAAGEYFLQVRHYNSANGTGPYHIRVSRQ